MEQHDKMLSPEEQYAQLAPTLDADGFSLYAAAEEATGLKVYEGFPYPDARKERELEKYSSLHAFIREVAVPEMQIKLRQGFGRAIRTESDTCVIAILDERACRGRRYAQAVGEALPEMRRTGSLREVNRFLREKKPESYFEVGR